MAFFVPCPNCGIRLRCATRLPAGTHLTCAACKEPFTVRDDAEPDRGGQPVRQARGAKTVPEKDEWPRARQATAEEEIPEAEILEEDPEDDRPPVRPPEHKPRPRRRPAINVASEGPARKRVLSPAVLTAIAASAIFVGLASALLIYFLVRDASKPSSADLLAHVPTDTVILSGYDLDELSGNAAFRRALEKRAPPDLLELDRAGVRSADLSRVVVARTVNNGNTCVVQFKTPPEARKYLHADLPGKSYAPFTSLTGNYRFGYFADSSTLVLADREPAIQALREKGAKARLGDELKKMVEKVRGPIWRASGRISAADSGQMALADDGLSLRIGPSAGTAAWAVPDGPLADVRFEFAFENGPEASQAAGALRSTFVNLRALNDLGQLVARTGVDPADIADIRRGYNEADVSENGTRVSVSVRLPASEALRAVGSVRN